jgi:hypothetical protein
VNAWLSKGCRRRDGATVSGLSLCQRRLACRILHQSSDRRHRDPILTVIVGAITVVSLPVSQFPSIAPPEVQVSTTYVGADAQTVEASVATPIEQQMSGVDNLNYMYSVNSSTGDMRLIVDFDVKTDTNTDLILTQIRQTQAASQLPAEVNAFGVTVQKTLTSPLMLISLFSPSGVYDSKFLANYAYINLYDQLSRVQGIGSVQVFGAALTPCASGSNRSTGRIHHRAGDRLGHPVAEYGEPCRPDRR